MPLSPNKSSYLVTAAPEKMIQINISLKERGITNEYTHGQNQAE